MKFFKFYIMLWSVFFLASCETEIETPDFQVRPESTTYQVGEPVRFIIEGNADMISFYSGEATRDYAFREGRTVDVADEGATVQFASAVADGGTQTDQLTFLASTDFNGNYESLSSVQAATWTDITDRFTYGTKATFVASTTKDISDLLVPGSSIYFAFRYVTKPQETNGLARNWQIQSFQLISNKSFNDVKVTITDQAHAGFRIVDQDPENAPSRSVITTTRVSLLGNNYKDPADPIYDPENPIYDPENPIYDPESHLYQPTTVRPIFVPYDPQSPYNDPHTENWAISKPIHINEVDLGPDWSTPVKGIANSKIEEYRYTYTKPGNYTAYFIATNASIEGRKDVIREINITIAP